MAIGLGSPKGFQLQVYNTGASDIPQGYGVELTTSAAAETLESIDDKVLSVSLFAGGGAFFGVADADIPADSWGQVTILGPTLVAAKVAAGPDTIEVNNSIQCDTADGTFVDFAAGTVHGFAMETQSSTAAGEIDLILALVSIPDMTFGGI